MKRFDRYFFVAIIAMAFPATTSAVSVDFKSDFAGLSLDGWVQYGVDAAVSGDVAELFPSRDNGDYFILQNKNAGVWAMSCSEYEDGSSSDEWLVSPEFEIPYDTEILCYNVAVDGPKGDYRYKVLVSESGSSMSDFTRVLESRTISASGNGLTATERRVSLKGLGGKRVRLAFVNTGNNAGMLGFADVFVAPYYISIPGEDAMSDMVITPDNSQVEMSLDICTPKQANGFNAVLSVDGFPDTEYIYDQSISIGRVTSVIFRFPAEYDFDGSRDYKITVSPNYEGAPLTELSGRIHMTEAIYPQTLLVEELTSTHCQACPAGFAFLEYWKEAFDGRAGRPLVVGSSIHVDFGYIDPMTMRNNSYKTDVEKMVASISPSISGSIPSMTFNRVLTSFVGDTDINEFLSRKSIYDTYISRVDYDEDEGIVKVNYKTRVCYDAENVGLDASVILLENGLSGTESVWSQTNGFANATLDMIAERYGDEVAPYFEPFAMKPTLVEGLVFNDIARGVYPSFKGEKIAGAFTNGIFADNSISFDMPAEVSDWKQTAVVLVLTKSSTGEVAAVSRLSADEYNNDIAGLAIPSYDGDSDFVRELKAIKVAECASGIEVESPCNAVINLYTPDGRQLLSSLAKAGKTVFPVYAKGMIIVQATIGDQSLTTKSFIR